jgi:amino acid permease
MSTAGYDEKTFVPSQDPNKKGFSDGVHVSKSTSPYDPDAAEAKTLHRGLNSRQISMIAIGAIASPPLLMDD